MSDAKHILLVDDDKALRDMLSEQLRLNDEFDSVAAATGAEGLRLATKGNFDIIILDAGLPDMDGREVCRLMRRAGVKAPIIMLTGADSDAAPILGPVAEANDCISKPLRLGVLLARLRAQIRQHEQSEDATLPIGPYSFKPSARLLVETATNKKVRLTDKETAILTYLYRSGNRVISREVLLDEVWGYNARVTTHTLETHVYRLRQKIERHPQQAQILITEPGGYRLAP